MQYNLLMPQGTVAQPRRPMVGPKPSATSTYAALTTQRQSSHNQATTQLLRRYDPATLTLQPSYVPATMPPRQCAAAATPKPHSITLPLRPNYESAQSSYIDLSVRTNHSSIKKALVDQKGYLLSGDSLFVCPNSLPLWLRLLRCIQGRIKG
jgi:hypothetical protein